MWMVLPDQAGSLQGSCSVSCNLLAANDPGIGSGWQQSKQNWTLLAVVGYWTRMACRHLFCAEGAPLQPLLFPQHNVFSPKTHGPKIRTFGTHAAKSMNPQIQTCSVDPGLFPGLGCGGSLDEGHDTDAMWMVLPVVFSVAPAKPIGPKSETAVWTLVCPLTWVVGMHWSTVCPACHVDGPP